MNKISKFLCTALATAMTVSCVAITAFAGDARTMTVTTDATGTLSAGDTVVVSITMDQTTNMTSIAYELAYNPDVFAIDTTNKNMCEEDEEYYEAYMDIDWLNESKGTNAFMKKLNTMAYTPTSDVAAPKPGTLNFAIFNAGGSAITHSSSSSERVIGKFIFTVKDTAASGTYNFTLDGRTKYDDNSEPAAITVPASVTVEAAEVPKTDVTVSAPAVSFTEKFEKDSVEYYHGGALLEFTVNSETNNEVQFVTVTANDGTNTNTKKIDLKTKITSGTVKVGLNILNVPTEITTITLSNIVTSAN